MERKASVKRVEKLVEFNGKMYCIFCGMICEKYTREFSIGYIEVMEETFGKENYEQLKKELI